MRRQEYALQHLTENGGWGMTRQHSEGNRNVCHGDGQNQQQTILCQKKLQNKKKQMKIEFVCKYEVVVVRYTCTAPTTVQ